MLDLSFDDLVAFGVELDLDGLVEGRTWYQRVYAVIDIAARWEDAKHPPGRATAVSFERLVRHALAADVQGFMNGMPARDRIAQMMTLGVQWSQQKGS